MADLDPSLDSGDRQVPIAGLIQGVVRARLRREVEVALRSDEMLEVLRSVVTAQINTALTSHLRRGSFRTLVSGIVAEVLAGRELRRAP